MPTSHLPNRIAIFCGASAGLDPVYARDARHLAAALARAGVGIVYGGGSIGLMGVIADAALGAGGEVTGVITRLLMERELGHKGCTQMHVVETMHERKMLMANYADAFIALPGGLGTLDELFEILAWAQLGIHAKPVALLNTKGYYDALWTFLDHCEREGFLRLNLRSEVSMHAHPDALVQGLLAKARANAPTLPTTTSTNDGRK